MMSKLFRIGMMLIVLTFTFVMTSCPDGNLPSGSTTTTTTTPPAAGDGWLGSLPVLFTNEQVYERDGTTPYSGAAYPFIDADEGYNFTVDGTGKLNGTLNAPGILTSTYTISLRDEGIDVSDTSVKILPIFDFEASDGSGKKLIYAGATSQLGKPRFIYYIYADRAATMSGAIVEEGVTYSMNWALKQGWNTAIFDTLEETWLTGQPPANSMWTIH